MKLATLRWGGQDTPFLIDAEDTSRGWPLTRLREHQTAKDVGSAIRSRLTPDDVHTLRGSEAVDLAVLRWRPPLLSTPKNIFCVGLNYLDHLSESISVRTSADDGVNKPCWFTKPSTSLAAHGDPVRIADDRREIDFEGEVAAVIGRRCAGVRAEDALDAVFGYTVLNDVSDRALQREREQWFLGKAADGHAPCGPWIVTADEIEDPQGLTLETRVNGELRQRASTHQMIHTFADLIADLSAVVTLEPGDVIAGGTPAGVGMADGRYLRDGDEVVVTVHGIGDLRTPIRSVLIEEAV